MSRPSDPMPAVIAVSAVLMVVMALASLGIGSVWMNPLDAIAGMSRPGPDLAAMIMLELRVPRMLLGIIVGGTLGLAGAVLQGLLRNPLADPGLLGVSSGASLGAVLALFYGGSAALPFAAPVAGLIGSLAATSLTLMFGRGGTLSMILAGAAVSGLFGSLVSLALNLAPNGAGVYEITTWLMGSITDKSWSSVQLAAPLAVVGWIVLASTARSLDALALGEAQAASLGVDLGRLRMIVLAGVALSVGSVTSVSGAIGFVGLVAPHLVRPFVGHQPGRILLPSFLVGASLLLASDICTRLLRYNGNEIKLGVLTALIGTPFFFWLVVRLRRTAP